MRAYTIFASIHMPTHDHHMDKVFMKRALDLATLGIGSVSPNPRVGAVVVYENKIIGEGWHQQFGGPHAEVNAINSVEDKTLLRESTVYVNLEPCSHHGKTPPCADLLIQHSVKKVVVANLDSNPLVAGEGIKKLRRAGIEVITGILEQEGCELNKRFFTFIQNKRPYIILKWAQTADGFIAQSNYDSKWISNEFSRQLVHKWRAEEDAVLVGSKTAMHDNPQLNVREWSGRDPVRIVIDRHLRLSESLKVFDGTQHTICYNQLKHDERPNLSVIRLDEENFILKLLHDLFKRNIQSIIVEGGAQALSLFIENNFWDEARVVTATKTFGKGIAAPAIRGNLIASSAVLSDIWNTYVRLPD